MNNHNGAIVSQVIEDSPAELAGVEEQDVIISVDGRSVDNSSKLKNLISSGRPKDKTNLTVIRDGREQNVIVTLGTRPGEKELRESYRTGDNLYDMLGLKVEPYSKEEDASYSFGSGDGVLVVEVKQESTAADNGIRKGDVITEVGKNDITSVNDYKVELKGYEKGDTIMFRIIRNGSPLFIAFEIE